MKAVIMAGGEGKRLKSVTGDLPKPMVPLLGRPMMEHILLLLKKHGITEICAAVKYRHEDISSYFGDGSRLGVNLQYRVEEKALGTAGGVKNCAGFYGDEDVLVINKPKGLVVHPAAGHADDTLVNGLLYALGDDLSGINGELRPGIVHRIDKDTSGLLDVAKNDYAHTMLASQLKDHTMARTYEAIVCGVMKEDCGTVDAPIGRHPTDRKKMCVTQRGGRNAVTHWEVVRRYKGYTHIRCKLETGRTHQIRVHMAYIGHPILGDTVYGRKKPELGQSSQCLHAGALCFQHPRDGHPVMVFAELPQYFRDELDKLEKMK